MRAPWAGLVLLGLLLLPVAAWAGRVFQWTDDKGHVHVTDNLWDLPPLVRDRYLAAIEEEARKKLTPAQIRQLKEDGNWPPLAMIRPPALKSSEELKEWMGFKLVGDDLDAFRAMNQEFRFQWESLRAEQQAAREALARAQEAVLVAEKAVDQARMDDLVMGRLGEAATALKAQKALAQARQQVVEAQARVAALPAKEAALLLGQRSYFHPGEDGGPAQFGRPTPVP
jgi:L-2-hydroxyglutarate oxidase LhgO